MISPYIAEFVGTAILLLLGSGIVANVSLSKTKGYDQNPLITITTAWGFAVFVAAFITGQFSGAHLNPAVTIGLVIAGKFSSELMIGYIIAQILGAMLGSWLTYLFYIDHYRSTNDESKVMGSFCTSPAIRNLKNNFFSEFLVHRYFRIEYRTSIHKLSVGASGRGRHGLGTSVSMSWRCVC